MFLETFDPATLLVVIGTFLAAGAVKGVIGLGLPTVSLASLTAAIDLPTAMALLLVPSFVTNLWQGVVGGHGMAIMRRTWPFMLTAMLGIPVGALALSRLNLSWLAALLGLLLIVYGGLSLAGVRLAIAPRQEKLMGPLFGTINGVLTGMTGSFVVPGVMYLQALGLPRDMLIQAMGLLFAFSTMLLAITLGSNSLLSAKLGWLSALSVIPAIAGMVLGQQLRHRLSEAVFRRVFFGALLLLGAYIIASALQRVL